MVMGIWNEEMEVWTRRVCFSQMSDPITSFKSGYAPWRENEFWERGTSEESPNFVEKSPPLLRMVIMISFMSIHIVGASYEIILLWGWSEGDRL